MSTMALPLSEQPSAGNKVGPADVSISVNAKEIAEHLDAYLDSIVYQTDHPCSIICYAC